MSHKSTPYDEFEEIKQVVLYGISDNMASLFQSGKYGAINTTDTETYGFYVIIFKSEAYTFQDNTTIDGKIINACELVSKALYHCFLQESTNWFMINITNSKLSQCQHAKYFIHDLMLP